MKDNKYKPTELIDIELQEVNGGSPNGNNVSCHHPGSFVLCNRSVAQGVTLGNNEPTTCTMCQHWGVEGPCDIDN